MVTRTHQYRLYPTASQELALTEMLADHCDLYNAALEERIGAWRRAGRTLTAYEQMRSLTEVRRNDPNGLGRWSVKAGQETLKRLDRAYKGFFRSGQGFPRFRSKARFSSVTFYFGDGLTRPVENKIRVKGILGTIRARIHRSLPAGASVKTATITRRADGWYVSFQLVADFGEACGSGEVGIDLGLTSLVAESNGRLTPAFRFARAASKRIVRLQRELARKKRGSKRREKTRLRLARAHLKVARQRADATHKLSRRLVRENRLIAFEDLKVTRMVRGRFAKSIHDAAWTKLVYNTTYKAESAGGIVVLVDPRQTSQTCPDCGRVERKPLSLRMHDCPCGCVLDRDVAAARVVLARARAQLAAEKIGGPAPRPAGSQLAS